MLVLGASATAPVQRDHLRRTAPLVSANNVPGAEVSAPWILSPAEYAAASAEYQTASGYKASVDPCEVAMALNVVVAEKCSREVELYGKQILSEFKAARQAVQGADFSIRDYAEAWASNYPSDLSEPGLTYAACAVAFDDVYTGDPQDAERLMPGHLVCTPSMVAYGKIVIERFDKATKAELTAK